MLPSLARLTLKNASTPTAAGPSTGLSALRSLCALTIDGTKRPLAPLGERIVQQKQVDGRTEYYLGGKLRGSLRLVKFLNGDIEFYDGGRGLERLTRRETDGYMITFDGEKGAERMIKKTFQNGDQYTYDGERGAERLIKKTLSNGEVHDYDGEKGAEQIVLNDDDMFASMQVVLDDERKVLLVALQMGLKSLKPAGGEDVLLDDDRMRNDQQLVLAAVSWDGLELEYASPALKRNRTVVRAAALNNVTALEFASLTLLDDIGFMLTLVSKNGEALQYGSDRVRGNMEVVVVAVKQNSSVLKYAFFKEIPQT